MRAIFYARGPNIRPGVKIAPFENVNIFSAYREDPQPK
jgi:hypothetical protein